MKERLSPLEQAIYAAAYVASFNESHGRGWRSESFTLPEWEARCTVRAIEDALGVIQLHRKHARKAK